MKSDSDTSDRQPGRPAKADAPHVPWEEIDRLLVHGEVSDTEDGVRDLWQYPSYRDLGTRYGVSHTLIARYSKNHNCMERREAARKQTRELSDAKLAEFRAEQLAVGRDDVIRCIDRFLAQFEQALVEGRVRCDNPSDYNTMLRLKSFIMGDADSRSEAIGGITLEDMQRAHARLLATEEEIRRNPAIAGIVDPVHGMLSSCRYDDDDGEDEGGSGPMLH